MEGGMGIMEEILTTQWENGTSTHAESKVKGDLTTFIKWKREVLKRIREKTTCPTKIGYRNVKETSHILLTYEAEENRGGG